MAHDRGPELQAVLIVCLVLCVVSTLLRCYSMGVILKRFYLEDWLAVVSLVRFPIVVESLPTLIRTFSSSISSIRLSPFSVSSTALVNTSKMCHHWTGPRL